MAKIGILVGLVGLVGGVVHHLLFHALAGLNIADGDHAVQAQIPGQIQHLVELVLIICTRYPAGAQPVVHTLQNNTFAKVAALNSGPLRVRPAHSHQRKFAGKQGKGGRTIRQQTKGKPALAIDGVHHLLQDFQHPGIRRRVAVSPAGTAGADGLNIFCIGQMYHFLSTASTAYCTPPARRKTGQGNTASV